ncbi:MAG: hypothetical protein HYX84_04360 [Chloroflexi bacterium]|nr:hypothetical protein [Chloroflexota bacterium]
MKMHRQSGLTTLELVIALAVAGLILPVIGSFFFQGIFMSGQRQANLAVYGDLSTVSEWLSQDLTMGPSGNNLSPSGSAPPYASVTIGSSSGFSGNNSINITYNLWSAAGAITTTRRTITYALEDLDPATPEIQLVRTDEDGKQVLARYVANPSHVVFSGSTVSDRAGGVSPGLTLDITSTVQGAREEVSGSASYTFALPRTFQQVSPSPYPAPATWGVQVPYFLAARSGYWQVINTSDTGNISARWTTGNVANLQLYIFEGQPFGTPSGDSTSAINRVPGTAIVGNSATTNDLTVSTLESQPAGTYTVYFFNNSTAGNYVTTTSASVTYASPGGELGQ